MWSIHTCHYSVYIIHTIIITITCVISQTYLCSRARILSGERPHRFGTPPPGDSRALSVDDAALVNCTPCCYGNRQMCAANQHRPCHSSVGSCRWCVVGGAGCDQRDGLWVYTAGCWGSCVGNGVNGCTPLVSWWQCGNRRLLHLSLQNNVSRCFIHSLMEFKYDQYFIYARILIFHWKHLCILTLL